MKIKSIIDSLIKSGFIKYGLVGVINTAVTGIIIFTLMNVFNISYKTSNIIGYLAGFINSFLLNRNWTFKSSRGSVIKQLIRFTAVFIVCYLLQRALLVGLVEKMQMNENLATLVGMVFYTFIGFIFNKLFTFKK